MKPHLLGLVLAAGVCCGSIYAEPLLKPTVTAVEAELMADMEARHLQPGKILYAKVTLDWNGLGCVLRKGAILEAEVVAVVPHTSASKESEVALAFSTGQCGNSAEQPLALNLAAISVPPVDDSALSMDMPSGQIGQSAPTATDPNAGQTIQGPTSGFRSLISSNAEIWSQMQHWFAPDGTLRAGTVKGIRGVKLSVGTGPRNSSVLSAKDRNVALDKHTLLLLVPGSVAVAHADERGADAGLNVPKETEAAGSQVAAAAVAVPTDSERATLEEEENCLPPACSMAPASGEGENTREAVGNISIRGLGYPSRLQQEMGSLDEDEALVYLGPKELLVAFNPHPLVPRYGISDAGSTVRVIRAALIDAENKKILRTVDWRLPDTNQYLWPLANHRALVHVGNELRIYGSGLKVEARIALSAPLSFVRTDPAGKMIAFGVLKERHTPELHAKLRESLEQEPEEDVQIQVLNERFETIASSMSVSGRMPPILLNEGEVKMLRQPDKSIRLSLHTWDNQWRSLTRFNSSCAPEASSLAPDLVLLVTCNAFTEGREYRVMRADGKLVLRGQSPLEELGHGAVGNRETKEFAVRILQANEPVLPGTVFHPANLQSEQFGVYRAVDGKRLFSVSVKDPSASSGGFALAPDGGQLAILARDQIALYAIPLN